MHNKKQYYTDKSTRDLRNLMIYYKSILIQTKENIATIEEILETRDNETETGV